MTHTNEEPRQEQTTPLGAEAVPEAVLIRRQAQAAEKELAQIKAERDRLDAENQTLRKTLDRIQTDQQLLQAARAAGAIDSETVCLLIRQQLAENDKADIPALLERLRREKSWLFEADNAARPKRSAGQRVLPDRTAALQQAAGRAERTGRLNDVQEYLRIRRQFT
ncbi:MAG TPA: hypothetical protein PKY88_12990 [Anaerohalosphaeraceae bacterium]|mgnify:FL=1|nr:hypothetical protein [Anaerohalosphaeraceae bacterium]